MLSLQTAPPGAYRIHRYPSSLIDKVALADGRVVTIRPVLPQDADAEQAFVAALSPDARRRRFHLGINTLPDSMLRAFTEIDYRTHVGLVAEAPDGGDDDRTTLIADARYVVDADGVQADFAIAVADRWQGLGLGRALMHRLARHARRYGLHRLCGDVLIGNDRMLALIDRLGGKLSAHPDDGSLLRACFALRPIHGPAIG